MHISKLQEHQHVRAHDKFHKGNELYLSVRFISYLKCVFFFPKEKVQESVQKQVRGLAPFIQYSDI